MKPKLLAWSDFIAPTGFANVAKNLYRDLHKDFDVSVVGINYFGDKKYDPSKYFVYSVTREDPLGIKRLFKIVKEDPPDILFLFQDIFHISDFIDELKKELPKKTKIVTYFPIDGQPFSMAWGNVLKTADVNITYTNWAVQQIKNTFPNYKKPLEVLYHGVDTDTFYKLSEEKIKESREQLNWNNKFVMCNVNRFQPRKAIPLLLRAFSMFAKGYKHCEKCGNYMPLNNVTCDLNGCDESNLKTVINNREDTYLYLHMMSQEYSMGPGRTNLLQNHLINAGIADKDYGKIIGINAKNIYKGEVSESDVNLVYNSSNLNITSTLGEGCGLSLLESQATGIPSVAPHNSAIPEMLNGTGTLVKNNATYSHPNDNAHVRPHVDPVELMKAIEKYYNEWKESEADRLIYPKTLENIKNNFLWNDKREKLTQILKGVLNKEE